MSKMKDFGIWRSEVGIIDQSAPITKKQVADWRAHRTSTGQRTRKRPANEARGHSLHGPGAHDTAG